LAEVETYSEEEYEQSRQRRHGEKVVLSRTVMYKRHLIEAFLDFSLVCVCWILSFVLRFEGRIEGYTYTLSISLPFIASCQMVGLYVAGLYRGMWRYITVSDANSAFYGVTGGAAVASFLIWVFSPIRAFPWSVVAIHSVLLLLAVVGVRMGLRTLRFHFAAKWRVGSKRALVVGAGDAGELAVREMFHNKALQLHPVGFLDDDPAKQRAAIHGVRVLGSRKQLLQVVNDLDVDEVIIAMPSIGNGVVQEVVDLCHEHGIAHRQVRGVIL
jgi:UDP-GlcNAc:undecaprenyl-phosphate GlcNAc-1-phosphate transferase